MSVNTPTEIYEVFSRNFSAGDIESLLALYEPDAVILPAPGQPAQGHNAIRAVLSNFLALKGEFQMDAPTVVESGDVALLMGKWTLKGTNPADGQAVEMAGQTSDIIRRQADGSWLFVIDNPFGAQNI
jgi:uncharacterized protein (TIGR02246 family)